MAILTKTASGFACDMWVHVVLVAFISLPWFIGCADGPSVDSISKKPAAAPSNTATYSVEADAVLVPKSPKEITLHAFVSKQQVQVGQSFDMHLEVTIPPTFHLYRSVGRANALKSVEITARSNLDLLKVGNLQLDDSSKLVAGNQVYTNRITANIPMTLETEVGSDQSVIDLQMSYQICNDLQCLAPSTISLSVPVSITQE